MANLSENEARRIYNDSIVINGMVGTTYAFDVFEKTNQTAAVFTLAAHNEDWNRAMELFKNYMAALIAHHDKMLLVESVDDIIRAKKEHKFGMIFGFQTATPIGMDWTNLWIMYKLGLRIMQLTYMNRTACGDGCQEVTDMGLTRFGQQMIRVMNQVGVTLDLSHCGWKTAEDALKYTDKPVICSHSNPYAVCKNSGHRNLPDEIIKGIAESGGVLGINGHPMICSTKPRDVRPDMSDYLDAMEYMIQVAGIDHVGIGPDLFHGFTRWEEERWHVGGYLLDGGWRTTIGLEGEEGIPNIAVGLAERGYGEEEIRKIMGGNFLRVFGETWNPNVFK